MSTMTPGLIDQALWQQAVLAIAEYRIWEGRIHGRKIKLGRMLQATDDAHSIFYTVELRRATVSDTAPTVTMALAECARLIEDQR